MPISLKGVSYRYESPSGGRQALEDVSLHVPRGTCLGILGPNGSGKTTLIRHMNGLLLPSRGEVSVGDLRLLPGAKRPPRLSREVGLVFQFPERQLFADTVMEDVAAGPRFAGYPEAEVEERALAALESAGLDPHAVRGRSPFTLTWGEKRKVAIAGTLVMNCPRLIFDEPGAGLDPRERKALLKLIGRLARKEGRTVVFVSHHLDDLFSVADRLAVVDGGRIVFDGNLTDLCRVEDPERWGLSWPPLVGLMQELASRGLEVRRDVRTAAETAAVLKELLPS